jgi:hypothetical protein
MQLASNKVNLTEFSQKLIPSPASSLIRPITKHVKLALLKGASLDLLSNIDFPQSVRADGE